MKTISIFLILFLCFSTVLSAQSKLGAGVKAGINVATQVTTGEGENVNTESLVGFHAGGYCHYFIIDQVAVQLELLFSQKGANWNDLDFSGKDRLCYIDIPLLFRFQPLEFLNVHAGPQFGFLMKAKQIPDDGEKIDIMDYYNSTDIGLVIGAEGNLPMKLNVTLRYILGLNVVTTESGYIDGWKNKVFQVSIGYRLLTK